VKLLKGKRLRARTRARRTTRRSAPAHSAAPGPAPAPAGGQRPGERSCGPPQCYSPGRTAPAGAEASRALTGKGAGVMGAGGPS